MHADHRSAPALVPLATHEPEARVLIDTAGGSQIAVRPQHNLFVSGRPREADAFLGKARSQSQAARDRLDEKEPEPRDTGRVLHEHHRASVFSVAVYYPATIELGIIVVDEIGDDLRAQAFERFDPAIFLRIKLGVTLHNPAEIAMPRLSQYESILRFGRSIPAFFDQAL